MKRLILIALALMLSASLMACGSAPAESTTAAPTTAAPATATPETTAAPETQPLETEAADAEEASDVNELLSLAETFIDHPVEELIAAIGEPEDRDYASSCLGPGEDGNLYYDGFIVYTYKEGDQETVRFVE